jgi:hypothetical protein
MPIPITAKRRPSPPRILIYGPGGIGKTTFASGMPGAVLVPVEEGADALDVPRTPAPGTWQHALDIIRDLTADRQGFLTLCIDSVTALQDLCYRAVCEEAGVNSVEAIGYGKGYVRAGELWRIFLHELMLARQAGMAILLIGHSATKKHEDPRLPAYDRLSPRLQINSQGSGIGPLTVEWCDVVGCAAYQVMTTAESGGFSERTRAVGDGERVLYLQERPAFLAKNRYGLPAEMPFRPASLMHGIREALATPTKTDAATAAT